MSRALASSAALTRRSERLSGRILFASTVSDLTGGGERSLLELACGLAPLGWRPALAAWRAGPLVDAFRDRGFDAHVYRELGHQPGSPLGGVMLGRRGLEPAARMAVWLMIAARPIHREVTWLGSVIERGGYSILHSNCDLSIPIAYRAAQRSGVPYVAHVRDHWRHWLHPRVLRALRCADAVLVASEDMARRFRAAGLAPHTVHNPVAPDRLVRVLQPGERAELRRKLAVDGGLAVAVIGRLDSQKRPDLAIRAVSTLVRATPGMTLVVAGRGAAPQEARLRRLAAEQGVEQAIRWLGHRTDVQEWLPAMDALMMPSEGEPFGRAIVEGMLAGLPVVAAADGAAVELVRDGVTGLLVPPGDVQGFARALKRLAAEPDLRARLGAAAQREALQRFDPAVSAARVAELYDRLSRNERGAP